MKITRDRDLNRLATESGTQRKDHLLRGRIAELGIELFLLFIAPLAIEASLNFQTLMQNRMIDPFVYTGYINNFTDLFQRYGLTYYGVRFGLILPSRFFTALMGPELGYLAFRYCLALLFGISLYAVAKRHLSFPVAIFTYIAALGSPYVARFIFWDHPDASGVPFLTAGICLFLLQPRRWKWAAFASGCFMGLAVHSNFFTVALIGIFALTYAGVSWRFNRDFKRLSLQSLLAVAGISLVTVAGILYYSRATGYSNILAPTFSIASSLSSGGMRQWRAPGVNWTLNAFHVFVPAWLALCCLSVAHGWKGSFERTAICSYGMAVAVFYYVHQFLMDSDTLQLFYYFSYAAPAIFLMTAVIVQSLWENAGRAKLLGIWIAGSLMVFPWLLFSLAGSIPYFHNPTAGVASAEEFAIIALGALFAATMAANGKFRGAQWVALVAMGIFCIAFETGFSTYSSAVGKRFTLRGADSQKMEWEVYRVAEQLIQAVPKKAVTPGDILFWYDNRVGNPINSIQSTYLWGFSKLNTNPPEDPGLPVLSFGQTARLNNPQWRFLGLLCDSSNELEAGIAALRNHAIGFKEEDRRVLAAGDYKVYWELVELSHP